MDESKLKRWVTINTSISADGLGVPTVSIYFSYCDKKDKTGSFCKGCFNPDLQKDGTGFLLSFEEIVKVIDRKLNQLEKMIDRNCGVCFLGGEAICEKNREMMIKLSEYYKDKFQIIYTWRTPELIEEKWIKYIDKIVCGEYIEKLNVGDEYVFGSSNQICINNKKEIITKYEGVVE